MNVPPRASQEIGLLTRLQVRIRITPTTVWTEVLILEITQTLSLTSTLHHTTTHLCYLALLRWSCRTMGTISPMTR